MFLDRQNLFSVTPNCASWLKEEFIPMGIQTCCNNAHPKTKTNQKTSFISYLPPVTNPFSTLLFCKSPWKNCWHPIISWTHFDEIFAPPSTKTTPMTSKLPNGGVSAHCSLSLAHQRPSTHLIALTFLYHYNSPQSFSVSFAGFLTSLQLLSVIMFQNFSDFTHFLNDLIQSCGFK